VTEKKLYFYPLSFLRFPLAVWVVFHHTFNADNLLDFNNLPKPIRILSNTGSMAPTVFFILSGFVIYNCLLGGKTKFYYNRFITIIPLYTKNIFCCEQYHCQHQSQIILLTKKKQRKLSYIQ
jgi:peptidoglycan/LPS O-acetylase OafA/YrhL